MDILARLNTLMNFSQPPGEGVPRANTCRRPAEGNRRIEKRLVDREADGARIVLEDPFVLFFLENFALELLIGYQLVEEVLRHAFGISKKGLS